MRRGLILRARCASHELGAAKGELWDNAVASHEDGAGRGDGIAAAGDCRLRIASHDDGVVGPSPGKPRVASKALEVYKPIVASNTLEVYNGSTDVKDEFSLEPFGMVSK